MDKYVLMKKVFALDSQRMELENRVMNLSKEIDNFIKEMFSLEIAEQGSLSEDTKLVIETFGYQIKNNQLIEKEKNMMDADVNKTAEDQKENIPKLIPINSPVRYDENGKRLWFGKTPDQFTESDKMGFLVNNELELNGKLSKETEKYLEDNGYKFYDQKLYKMSESKEEKSKDLANQPQNPENQQKHCRGYAYVKGQQKPQILHANTPEEIILRLQSWNKARPEDMKFKVVNIGSLDNEQNKYTDYHKYDVATGKDISPVYLQIPKMEKEEFLQTVSYLKENGAKYLPNQHKWYISQDMEKMPFKKFLPDDNTMQAINVQPENAKEYSLLLSKDVEANECMVAFHDGREPMTLHGDQFGVNFAQFKTPDEVVEIVDDFIKKQMEDVREETLDLDKLQPGDKLECYVPEYRDDGFREIISMQKLEAIIESKGGYQNEIYYFAECSLSDYSTGAAKNILFSESQANVINRAIESQIYSGVINVIADATLSVGQMDVMVAAAKDGFLVPQIMEFKSLAAPDMDMMRIGLQNGVEKNVIQGICSKELSWAEKRQVLNGEIRLAENKIGETFKKQGYPINRETARKVIQLNHCTHQKNKLEHIADAFKNQTFKDTNAKAQRLVNDISKECQTVAMAQHQCSV